MNKISSWIVHIFTSTGLIFAYFSILAIVDKNQDLFLILMFSAFLIDGFDGTLARKFNVKKNLPMIDGALLDNIVDYLNYTFIPVLFLHYFEGYILREFKIFILIGILLSSAYQFSRVDAKTEDKFFKGFPSTWNFVVMYFILFNFNITFNTIICIVFIFLSFMPIKFIYPTQTTRLKKFNLTFGAVLCILIIIFLMRPNNNIKNTIFIVTNIYLIYYLIFSLYFNINLGKKT